MDVYTAFKNTVFLTVVFFWLSLLEITVRRKSKMTKGLEDKEIKLIALDMDGTLLNENGEIPEENRKAIKEAHDNGLHVVLSTGRSIATCNDHAKSLLLKSYLVTVNGSEIWDTNGNLIERNLVDANHIKWMWELAQQNKTKIWATSCNRL